MTMKDKLFSLRNLLRRIFGDTPSFFQKLFYFMTSLAVGGAGLAKAISEFPTIFDGSIWINLAANMIGAGTVGAIVAKLVVKDNTKAIAP